MRNLACNSKIGGRAFVVAGLVAAFYFVGRHYTWAESGPSATDWQKLTQGYATAAVQAAEARLAAANALNKTVPGTYTSNRIEAMARSLEAARTRERALKAGNPVDASMALVACAELSLQRHESAYDGLRAAEKAGGGVAPEKLSVAKSFVEFAKARVELAKAMADQSAEVRQRWEIELLVDELHSIQQSVSNLEVAQ
jgi:hypothetical protein